MSQSIPRPENRHRNACESASGFDTEPMCYRSEAFAEDLPPASPRPSVPSLLQALKMLLMGPAAD